MFIISDCFSILQSSEGEKLSTLFTIDDVYESFHGHIIRTLEYCFDGLKNKVTVLKFLTSIFVSIQQKF